VCPSGFQILINQIKSKNNDIFHGVMLSYMEAVVKHWEGFAHLLQTMFTNRSI
jgi:hypothetical protein